MATVLQERKKRISLRLPVQVRGLDAGDHAFEEVTQCLNVSADGILFESGQRLLIGTRLNLRIDIPSPLRRHFGGEPIWETPAVITRLEATEGQSVVRVGARFIEPSA